MKRSLFFLFALAVALAAPVSSLLAVPVTDISDRMSDQREGAASDHEFRFVNTDAINAPGKIIDLVFAPEFSLATITAADIGFTHGPTTGLEVSETLGPSSGPGIWAVNMTGNTIHFASPTDATTGELPVGHTVIFKIGLNAGGTHQIVNPSSAGSYTVSVNGCCGQYDGTGTATVPIVSSAAGGFTIGFTVPGTTPAPPDPGPDPVGCGALCVPPPPPAQTLAIGSVQVTAITEASARVSWTTNLSAESRLYFLGTDNRETLVASDLSGQTHAAELTDLLANARYRFVIRASAAGGATAMYGPGEFKTLELSAVPNVRGFQAMRLGDGRVGLSWANPGTDLAARVTVVAKADRYPTGPEDGRVVFDADGTEAIDMPGPQRVFYAAFVRRGVRSSSGSVAEVAAVVVAPPTPIIPLDPGPTPRPDPRPIPRPPATVPTRPPTGTGATVSTTVPALPPPAPVATTTEPVLPAPTVTAPDVPLPPIPTAPTTPPASTGVIPPVSVFRATVVWQTQDEKIILAEDGGRPRVFTGDAVRLVLTTNQELRTGQVTVDGSRYALAREGALAYATTFVPGAASGSYDASFSLIAVSGEVASFSRQIEVVPPARILERDQYDRPAQGAAVRISVRRENVWEPLARPAMSVGEDGAYRVYLPAGQYQIEVSKDGWQAERQEFGLGAPGPLERVIVLRKNPVSAVAQALEAIRTPQTRAAASIAAPFAVAATLGTTVAVSAFNVLNYLRFLLTQPLLLLRRRRRDKWGVVYHALTKRPVELAVVRLLDAKTGAVRQTRITDAQGRFAFLAPAGSYRIEVRKPGFIFPTQLLASERIDVDLIDLYHGERIDAGASASLTPNIPLDPVEKTETPQEVVRKRRWRRAQSALSVASLLVAGVSVLIQPTWLMAGFAIAQALAFLLFRRLAIPAKPKNWGIAYDGATRKPLKQAVVRIFDKRYNKLLETQVTGKDGKYAFFAGKNVFYVTADRVGYEKHTSKDVDLRQETLGVVHEPLALMPSAARPAVPPGVST